MNGVNVGLEKDLKWPDNYFKLSSVLSFERYKLNEWYSSAFIYDTGKSYTFSLTEQLSRTSLNHPIFPTSGSNISLRVSTEEHTSELPSLLRITYAVLCLKIKTTSQQQ